ncbi:hypothetical protein U9M48_011181 [Paspalum notatum var. saurae]|uniref:RING-type E3 ubiquitin transferase n=1 Tax=Paspalum notatum var. saurae TaxID=547442 RepID=A0AAQ3SVN2_PASNO
MSSSSSSSSSLPPQGRRRHRSPAAAFGSSFRPPNKRRRAPACSKAILGLRQITAAADCPSAECAICLHDFDFDSDTEISVRALPCSHAFHQDCISQWLRRNAVCPLCRYQLPTEELQEQEEEEEDFYFAVPEELDEQERRFIRRWSTGPGIRARGPLTQEDQDFIDWQDRRGLITEDPMPIYREPVLDAEALRLRRITEELRRRYL